MFLAEYQSKELLAQYGVLAPDGRPARSPDEAQRLCKEIDARKYVVKAQIGAGGRGLAGGIRFAATPSAVADEARRLLGSTLVTDQTGPAGETVTLVQIEAAIDIAQSCFVAIAFDPETGQPMLLASGAGGVEFEQRARMDEDTAQSCPLPSDSPEARAKIAPFLTGVGISEAQDAAIDAIFAARLAFTENDMTLIEINPFARTTDGRWMAVDAKVAIDPNAGFRRPEFASMVADRPAPADELAAQKHNINLVRLEGNIGVVANGAGLGLATNDMITDAGGKAANFMDIRTTASSMDVARGVEILLADDRVSAILLTIHGGGMTSADTVAEGVNFAYAKATRKLPVIAYISGKHADWGHRILRERKVPVESCDTLSAAVGRVVELAGQRRAR
ncbi:succinyl-CoA synthetase subunit beta [Roseovarius sp. TM1035]|jgi:succinyl-CoA synthetase beta subunit|uniref:ATP-grasp domain-containing protein n=1 Tax=Roseovarius sp. TM1035 TaxID=391613 RepID=UPI0001556C27|nr:ATP-grasp domain-containing protein [Roseovarius sp. TM1035]AWZ22593.1 Succinyl-CoA ligase, ADP-forming beta chain [Roseovarius sp. AK1035]EDM32323.1 succinyl-CoA synthetase subunit beta [Roseovarius sp. TM1035]